MTIFRGELQLLRRSDSKQRREWLWAYLCHCGNEFLALKHEVAAGHVKSCGCSRISSITEAVTTHGHASGGATSRTYRSWVNMTSRCGNPKVRSYAEYGLRGISVCEAWRTFAGFLSAMGEAPEGMTLERKDSNGNYEPNNCKWASRVEQANNKRSNVGAIVEGVWVPVSELAEKAGIRRRSMEARLRAQGKLVTRNSANG